MKYRIVWKRFMNFFYKKHKIRMPSRDRIPSKEELRKRYGHLDRPGINRVADWAWR